MLSLRHFDYHIDCIKIFLHACEIPTYENDVNVWRKEIKLFDFMIEIMKTIFKSTSSRQLR